MEEFVGQEKDRINLLLSWRKQLMEGRVRPDKTGNHTHVRESLEYIGLITRIDKTLTDFLKVEGWETF